MQDRINPDERNPARAGASPDPALLEAAFASMGAGVLVVDTGGAVAACNPQAEWLLGHPPGGLLGRGLHQDVCFRGPGGQAEPTSQCPLLRVARTGRLAAGDEDLLVRADGGVLPVAWTSAPLRQMGRITGAVVVLRDVTHRHQARARRAERHARGQEARRQAEDAHAAVLWLVEVTDALVSTLDAQEALGRLAKLLVPRLADWAALDVATGPGQARRMACAWSDGLPAIERAGVGPLPRFAPSSPTPLARALGGAGTRLLTDVGEAGPGRDAMDEAQREQFAALGAVFVLLLPLRLRGDALGAMTLVRTDPARPFTDDEVVLAEEVARRTALSLENARLYGQQAGIATVLQRSLLTDLPNVEDLELAASYRPAQREAEIGGDWYDAFVLPGGDLAVVVGDVVGHDLQAASRMGALRNMLRALAVDRARTPGEIMQRLDAAMVHLDVAESATAIYSRLRPAGQHRWRFTWSNAGHPPPLLLTADGETAWLEGSGTLLLGVAPGQPRPTDMTMLPPGATVLLYTDGLVESRTRSIDVGMSRLRRSAAAEVGRPLEEMCTALINALGDPGDDMTVIAVRTPVGR
ncbi:SpoIIE family protein phosphatase [Wenjunlia tyrosinilytica]|nr:SpoIIE family protein phosphatase [Wenjunlia tyrosinilytica]